jgi:hypothetical protein
MSARLLLQLLLHSSSSRSGSSTSSTGNAEEAEAPGVKAQEAAILSAVKRGDLAALRRWARKGARIISAYPVWCAAFLGNIPVLRFLVKELGADVNQEAKNGACTVLIAAATKVQSDAR